MLANIKILYIFASSLNKKLIAKLSKIFNQNKKNHEPLSNGNQREFQNKGLRT